MVTCRYGFESYIREKYYSRLELLPSPARAAEQFRLMTEELPLHYVPGDRLFGWFGFEEEPRGNPRDFPDTAVDPETLRVIELPGRINSRTSVDRGHTCLDYERILTRGLAECVREIDAELVRAPDDGYLPAMRRTLDAVGALSARVAAFLRGIMPADAAEAARLEAAAAAAEKVPTLPAETFLEAVQSVWFIHFLTPMAENAWYSISLGRFDRYMLPYYRKARADGVPQDEIVAILRNLWTLLNSYADGACLLNVGGDYNEFSELLIECQRDFAMPAPILGARVSEETPDRVWSLLIDDRLFSRGQPTFYSERGCAVALVEKGLSPEDARLFTNNSCMGIGIAGREFNSMWGCVTNVCAVLELALNGGRLLRDDPDIRVDGIGTPDSLPALMANFERCFARVFGIMDDSYRLRAALSEREQPDPFVSALTGSCIARHCDRISGADFHNVTVECMGMVNAADGIAAVDRLVFRERRYTVAGINAAVAANFEGYEALRRDLLSGPKYGRGSDADGYAAAVADVIARVVARHNAGNRYYMPSLHTLDANVGYGLGWGAGHDGRGTGEPFAKNAGPSNRVRTSEPTSVVLSAARLPQTRFYGGQPIDIHFLPGVVRDHPDTVRTLIETYFAEGGLQFQVNSLSAEMLRDAAAHPDRYPDLVVRIGGYSIRFAGLSEQSKAEFIERFEREETR